MRRGLGAAVVGRGVSIVAGLLLVPVLLHHLGPERFGIWSTITSLTLLLTFADLGLSNGLVNAIADADATSDRGRMQIDVSSVVAILSVVAGTIIAAFVLLSAVGDTSALIGSTRGVSPDEVRTAVAAFVVVFVVSIPLNVVFRIHMGLQESATTYSWLAAGVAIGFVATFVAVRLGGGLGVVVATTVLGPMLAALLCAFRLFYFTRRWLTPRPSYVRWTAAKLLLGAGGLWFVIQAAVAVSYQSDALVINHVIGPSAVSEYTVAMRLFGLMPTLLSLALQPLWPAVRNALAQRDVDWVRRAFLRMTVIGTVFVMVPTMALFVAGPWLINLWTSGAIAPSRQLLLALSLWAATICLVTPVAYLLAGASALRFQAATHAVMAVLNLGLSISLAHRVGVAGVVYATVIANVVCIIVPSLIYIRRANLVANASSPVAATMI